VDVLFRSSAKFAGKNAIRILLTGMGNDGAQGLLEIKEAGVHTVTQEKKYCVVFGMTKESIQLNAADKVLPLSAITHHVMGQV
jgi:two-component system chemotaxis response regulator CheB